jgi:hypothetical protein
MSKALFLTLLLLLGSLSVSRAVVCDADNGATGTAPCGTAGQVCDTSVTDGVCRYCSDTFSASTQAQSACTSCTYTESAEPGLVCTACDSNAYNADGSNAATSTCYYCADVNAKGYYGCVTCDAPADANGTPVCTAVDTDGTHTTYTAVDSYTGVGWQYSADGLSTQSCLAIADGCEQCLALVPDAASDNVCQVQFDGFTLTTSDPIVVTECQDPFCDACDAGAEDSACTGSQSVDAGIAYYESDSANVVLLGAISSAALGVSDDGTTLTCKSNAFRHHTTDLWCLDCEDPSIGVEGASSCALDSDGLVQARACKDGYAQSAIAGTSYYTCTLCGDGIAQCTFDQSGALATVDACLDGYALVGTTLACAAVPDGATQGSFDDAGVYTATGCGDGYYLNADTNACDACAIDNAVTCSDASTATACAAGYYLDASNACQALFDYLGACTNHVTQGSDTIPTSCSTCAPGYGWTYENRCVACGDNQDACVQVGATTFWATACADGYYVQNGACVANPDGCDTIYQTNAFRTKVGCLICAADYYLNLDDGCTSCGDGVASCVVHQYRPWATACADGYEFQAGAYDATSQEFTYPACTAATNDATNGLFMAVSYLALLALLFIAIF